MANAAVSAPMRAAGWNVRLFAGQRPSLFAGVFQDPGSDLVTFRDIVDELRLCFEAPWTDTGASWDGVAFGLMSPTAAKPAFVTEQSFDKPVPSLAPAAPKRPAVVKYQVVRHGECSLSEDSPLSSHIQAKCAQHISQPLRRRDPRYLSPKATSLDPRFAAMPVRRKVKARSGSQSPPKRPASSLSPTRRDEQDDDDMAKMVAPLSMNIDEKAARVIMDNFRSSLLLTASCCAISGLGDSWVVSPAIGPALQACHIIPQRHFHLYPGVDTYPDDDEECRRLIHEAWRQTWNPKNGILLMSHLHELFDARLISIHPDTLRIRVFVPYNVLTVYNGQEACVPDNVDREVLRHHYEMCCIENMGAEMPLVESVPVRLATSGKTTPLTPRSDMPATPSSGMDVPPNPDPLVMVMGENLSEGE
ncbi:hypothetical protein AK830_g12205 [Neonectria ditissima]|uniref:HNH nuclease domain-containing protein n=1 Tax=Neonectria ditissima TaxID=78410 RepID=A0A0P7B5Z1_9HYPO|nr:hypothetical protein AK830_g12205 [Neonectria ditissima]